MKIIVCDKCGAKTSQNSTEFQLNPPMLIDITGGLFYGLRSEYQFCYKCKTEISGKLFEILDSTGKGVNTAIFESIVNKTIDDGLK